MADTMLLINKEELQAMIDDAISRAIRQSREELPVLYSQKEAANFLGVTIQTIIRWEKSGRLIPKIIGGKKRYSKEQLWKD